MLTSVCPTVSVLRFYGCCHPCFNIDMFEILPVSRKNVREIFMRKKFISDDLELYNLAKKVKKYFGGKRGFSAGAAVLPPFLHSSILFSQKQLLCRILEM